MPDRTTKADYSQLATEVEFYLQEFFLQNAERYDYGDLFEPLYHDLSEFVTRRGKRIRPLLLLRSYQIFGGDRPVNDRHLLKVAVSLELLHAFILIHDDVIDQSERRRGLPTFHKQVEERMGRHSQAERVGRNVATVMGDMLFALSIETIHATDFPFERRDAALARFLRYLTDTGAGEINDILLGTRDLSRTTEECIEQMYTLKTTRYTFEAPCVLGAIFAGAGPETLDAIARLTEPLGLAFQIQNDLIEFSHFDLQDRAMQTDLLEGKKTLLIRAAFDRLNEMDRSFLQLCLSSGDLSEASILKIRELIAKAGAVEDLQARMEELFARAEQAAEDVAFTGDQREGLQETLGQVRRMIAGNSAA
ncbi:MAG: polyprenyl synthetase family protein [Verrucomicrobiota bacterium]